MKCVEMYVHKKIDRSEMNKKSYVGPYCPAPAREDGYRYYFLLDAIVA